MKTRFPLPSCVCGVLFFVFRFFLFFFLVGGGRLKEHLRLEGYLEELGISTT